jgi:hypothetical protein
MESYREVQRSISCACSRMFDSTQTREKSLLLLRHFVVDDIVSHMTSKVSFTYRSPCHVTCSSQSAAWYASECCYAVDMANQISKFDRPLQLNLAL